MRSVRVVEPLPVQRPPKRKRPACTPYVKELLGKVAQLEAEILAVKRGASVTSDMLLRQELVKGMEVRHLVQTYGWSVRVARRVYNEHCR
jgi:hypothetical protein